MEYPFGYADNGSGIYSVFLAFFAHADLDFRPEFFRVGRIVAQEAEELVEVV